MLSVSITILLAIHVFVSVLIVFIVLMQRPKSEGLGAAFGGGMTENLFGAQTSNVLANATRWLGGIFFFLTLLLSILYARQSTQKSSIQSELLKQAAVTTPLTTGSASALSGTAALSGTGDAFGNTEMKLGVPVESASNSLLGATPPPVPAGAEHVPLPAGPIKVEPAAPKTSGSY